MERLCLFRFCSLGGWSGPGLSPPPPHSVFLGVQMHLSQRKPIHSPRINHTLREIEWGRGALNPVQPTHPQKQNRNKHKRSIACLTLDVLLAPPSPSLSPPRANLKRFGKRFRPLS
ncbi:hypothetical protein CDAR_250071 [Caerostris darwini]|uniref:Uncharacterized protein n=1 Tax=Caerostris darwini TaxID=1538125 RepID=A0AAV4R5W1_9ARAC|nr:hypothetical protein CDAR_250071 [Caerostris darwini]